MNKRSIVCLLIIFICIVASLLLNHKDNIKKTSTLNATILKVSNDYVTVSDKNNIIYTFFQNDNTTFKIGESINVEYSGKLDKNKEKQTASIVNVTSYDTDDELQKWNDNGIFSEFYQMAYNKMKTLSLEEKIGQIFLVRVPDKNKISDLNKYKFGGYLLYERDFKDKTKQEVIKMIDEFQENSNIPFLIATDEEGGKVIRISSNTNLVESPFKSPSELYKEGKMQAIKIDTIEKTEILQDLGINVNLAPVVDVSMDPNSYMYERTIKENTSVTSDYAKTVIDSSKGSSVSYVLKHFPGYGDNADTHITSATDNRTYATLMEDDIPPFKAGIKAGAEAILFSHITVLALDKDNPATLSATTHNFLRNELGFTGISITDDLDMDSVKNNDNIIKAILAGNDLLIVTDYENAISKVKNAINNGDISETVIDKMVFRILAWKYYKGLMYDIEK